MTTRGYIFGHACIWDDDAQIMRYEDTGEPASIWGGELRTCPECGQMPTSEGYDPCLGHIPGASAACCGHGVERGYIFWPKVQQQEAQEEMKVRVPVSLLQELMRQAGLDD